MMAHVTFFNHVHGEDGAAMLAACLVGIAALLALRYALGKGGN